ncbi:MAG: glycosyltransferase family 2 protein [Janthinobacterium lividum]
MPSRRVSLHPADQASRSGSRNPCDPAGKSAVLNTVATPLIEILLATYNGEGFLREQIDSLLAQTYPNLRIIARDDGSSDGTRDILEAYALQHAERFHLLPADAGTGNAKWNFLRLMEASTAPFVALADQDDFWLPDKLRLSMEAMQLLQQAHGAADPLLVFTDLTVVNRDLEVIHPSFWRHQHIEAERIVNLPHLLAQNVVTGCTALLNRALVQQSLGMPAKAFMHDWWIALNASVFGHARAIPVPTMLYRQHENNAVGAVIHGRRRFWPRLRWHHLRRAQWEMSAQQAEAFLAVYRDQLPADKRRILEAYVRCETSPNRLVRVGTYLRYRFFQKGLRPNLAMLWYLWDMKAAKRASALGEA